MSGLETIEMPIIYHNLFSKELLEAGIPILHHQTSITAIYDLTQMKRMEIFQLVKKI